LFVEVLLLNGDKFLTVDHEVHEEEAFVSLYDPQAYGHDATTRKVLLDLIMSVAVTDVEWREP
jgi:hypothetical protein